MKKCRYCAEEIQSGAVFCRYCGKRVKGVSLGKVFAVIAIAGIIAYFSTHQRDMRRITYSMKQFTSEAQDVWKFLRELPGDLKEGIAGLKELKHKQAAFKVELDRLSPSQE